VVVLVAAVGAAPAGDLPVLFQFQQPTHNVAVFRGADLKNAIAAGLVKGFGASGAGESGSGAARAGKKLVVSAPVAPVVKAVVPAPVVVHRPVVHHAPTPVVVHRPAPVVVHRPVVPAPAPVVTYKPAPKVAYKPYVDPYADEPAVYTYNYAVADDYSASNFDAAESRDNYLTTGKYSVALPDGRVQTVTYTVDGGNGYVADVVYTGEAQYPTAPAPGYSA